MREIAVRRLFYAVRQVREILAYMRWSAGDTTSNKQNVATHKATDRGGESSEQRRFSKSRARRRDRGQLNTRASALATLPTTTSRTRPMKETPDGPVRFNYPLPSTSRKSAIPKYELMRGATIGSPLFCVEAPLTRAHCGAASRLFSIVCPLGDASPPALRPCGSLQSLSKCDDRASTRPICPTASRLRVRTCGGRRRTHPRAAREKALLAADTTVGGAGRVLRAGVLRHWASSGCKPSVSRFSPRT